MAGIIIEVDLDTGEIKKGFDRVGDIAGKEGKKSGQRFEKGLTKSISVIDVAVGNILASLATASLGAVSNFVRGSISAANRQEDAINNLNAALKRSGEFSEAASKDLQDFAASVQAISIFGDEAVIEQLAFAKSLGLTSAQAKEVVTAAVNLSSALGISLESATRNIAKTFSGLQGELGELLPTLRGLTQEQLKAGEAAALINREFAGAAQSRIDTARGSYDQLTNTLGDVVEKFGALITESDFVQAALKGLDAGLKEIISPATTQEIDRLNAQLERQKNILRIETARGASDDFKARLQAEVDATKGQIQTLALERKRALDSENTLARAASEQRLRAQNDESDKRIASLGILGLNELDALSATYTAQQQQLADAFEGRLDLEEEFLTRSFELRRQFDEAERAIREDSGSTPLEDFVFSFADALTGASELQGEFLEETKAFSKNVAQALKGGIASGAANAFSEFGRALATGENAFDAFAKSFIGSIGQIAVQQGQAFILQGIGYQFIPGFQAQGSALIAAGAALATFGGALGALSGGSSAPSVGGGSGDAGAGNIGQPIAPTPQEELRENQIGVTVNIQGDVLDSEESGLRFAELLQQAVNDQGFRVA